ncbi:thioredoxin family protein [Rhizosphaericola mali]|uniref:Thioredoxin family protein n=1 Tax=Rhizosphaericola mali TaxID=2545455 RepID=A0A5P2G6L0_9BACT|nr:thioredoxin family protein [Rhizosphaericola mali]QES88863.1 thioredoxin family protein [Rhizosphaericola mali]
MRKLKFEQPKCAPCKQVDEFLEEQGIEVEHINAWEKPEIASKYRVTSCPTIIVLDNNNVVAQRIVGFKPDEIKQLKFM